MHRRALITGLVSLVAAPAIVRVVSAYDYDGLVLLRRARLVLLGEASYSIWLDDEIRWLETLKPGIPKRGHWRPNKFFFLTNLRTGVRTMHEL